MADHPIEALMDTAMENIKGMVDVNTIVGDPVETADGSVIVPISKVSFGFAAGGSEYTSPNENGDKKKEEKKPFGGGSGAGVMLQPVAFLVVGEDQVRLLPVNNNAVIERLINVAPELLKEFKSMAKNNSKSGDN
ncbi:GerW family sporulation protein [Selenihalanaerobacter shriftii]|uniref:Sporulation protein YtfJ n=1 Tax=Selenihalanaerobacter shriftii TaxID=142842 RepID=A0A1T4M8M6_9FIRM|nr:GerW family sporulation protein [Selenihalanaerobacter shriftii]SJZ63054.1 sporulation protein YtfJ [Selenihalanaerobacter shriftii]